ncbi:MAG: ABC transporter permease [Lachnospiraceae bacterium]|nr:ABC transporter permease [Lachnospiraceae bacterium]
MKVFYVYLKLQLKKFFRYLPTTLLTMVLVCGLLGGIAFLTHISRDDSENIIYIGVVAKEDEPYLDWIIDVADNMESTEYTCEFVRLKETDAEQKLKQGELTAVFVIPKNYIRSLIKGNAEPVIIRFGRGQAGITAFLVRILGDAASHVMTDTQAGIYAMNDYYTENRLPGRITSETLLNINYLQQVLTREKLYITIETDENKTLQNGDYYFAGCLVLFFLCMGMGIGRLLLPENKAMRVKLPAIGLGNFAQTLAQYSALFLIYAIIYMALSLSVTFIFLLWKNPLSVTTGYDGIDWLILWTCMFPVLLPICGVLQCIFFWAKDTVSGVLFLFFTTLICGYLSGYFYPLSYFPEKIQTLSAFLPTGCFRNYLTDCMSMHRLPFSIVYLLLYTAAFFSLSTLSGQRGGVRK